MASVTQLEPARRVEAENAFRNIGERLRTNGITEVDAEREVREVEVRFWGPNGNPEVAGTARDRVTHYMQAFSRTHFQDAAPAANGQIQLNGAAGTRPGALVGGHLGFEVRELPPQENPGLAAFRNSNRGLADLQAFAQQSPQAATQYLTEVRARLVESGQTVAAAEIDRILAAPGDLGARLAASPQLGLIFPTAPQGWAQAGTQRATAPGWNQAPSATPHYITGQLSADGNGFALTTPSGKRYGIAQSERGAGMDQLPVTLNQAFAGDGPVTVQGTLGADGTTFKMEGAVPNPDGSYDRFVPGRVVVSGQQVALVTPRGNVAVTNPELANKLRGMPNLAVMLPGSAEPLPQPFQMTVTQPAQAGQAAQAPRNYQVDQQYSGNPSELFALAKFGNVNFQAPQAGMPGRWLQATMAHGAFNAPITGAGALEPRMNHVNRTWMRGSFVTDPNGRPLRFDASYVGRPGDAAAPALRPAQADADPVASAVMLSESGTGNAQATAVPPPAQPAPAPAPAAPAQPTLTPQQAAANFNAAGRTAASLGQFAQAAPQAAEAYLNAVAQQLRGSGHPQAADALQRIATGQGTLAERIAANPGELNGIFPQVPNNFATAATMRAQLGWAAPADQPDYITGTLTKTPQNQLTLTTPDGRTYQIAQSSRIVQQPAPMVIQWLQSFAGDGPVTIQGKLAQDGQTLNVEGYALNTDGQYGSFTYGRVNVVGDQVTVQTPRWGAVPITDPNLHARLKAMPRLGIVLPGEPQAQPNGTYSYAANPQKFFGLGRFMETTTHDPVAGMPNRYAAADMAYSIFSRKPVTLPAEHAPRVNHGNRVWLRGDVVLDGTGVGQRFDSDYVGKDADQPMAPVAAGLEVDSVQHAVMTAPIPQ